MANPNHDKKTGRFISKGTAEAQNILDFIGAHSGLKMTAQEVKIADRRKKR